MGWHRARRLLMCGVGLIGILAAAVVPALPAAASDAYSWGDYGGTYTRTRVSQLPASVPPGAGLYSAPWIVPSPDPAAQSQSTPISVGDTIYWFAFTSPTEGALYSSSFLGGEPGPAKTLVTFAAASGEQFNTPGDPSISPGGHWLAYAAGRHLRWWRVGDWCAANSSPSCPSGVGQIQQASGNVTAYVSSAPTFVHDPAPGSGGRAICSGSGDGGFACYSVEGPAGIGSVPTMIQPYTTSGSPITSSAVTVPPAAAPPAFGGDPAVCFGIASFARPRIECLDPLGSARQTIGQGEIDAPVDSALAYGGGDLWATDQDGGAYAFVAASGVLAGRNTSAALTGGGISIAPPSVDLSTGQVFVVADGYQRICSLQATGNLQFWTGGAAASCFNATQMQGTPGQFTAPTVTPGGAGCDVVWDATNGGQVGASNECTAQPPVQIDAAPDAGLAGHNFSAVVVGVGPGSQYLVMWSDLAVTYWQNACGGCVYSSNPYANYVATPPGGDVGSGLEVWGLAPPLDAWLVNDPITAPPTQGVPQGGECVFAVTNPGASFVKMTYSDALQTAVPMQTVTGNGLGAPPGLPGCPAPPASEGGDYGALLAEWGVVPPGGTTPEAGGTTPPSQWEGGSEYWVGYNVVAPTGRTALPITVTATTPQGGAISEVATLYTNCPAGDTGGSRGVCQAPAPIHSGYGNNCGDGHQACPPPYHSSGPTFTGPNCIPPNLPFYPGSCVTAWLINPAHPPVCGQTPIGGNQWNPHPGCITDSGGAIRDPNVPGGWAILPNKEFNPVADCPLVLPAYDCPPPTSQGG